TGRPSEVAVGSSSVDTALAQIRDSVAAGHRIEFDYLNSRGESEKRTVDPLRIQSLDQDWYLRGWDHSRQAVRTFRLDRMSTLTTTDEPISHHAAEVPMSESLFESSDTDLEVVVELPDDAIAMIADYLTADAPVRGRNGRSRVTLHVAHDHGLKRLIAGLSGVVTVISPDTAKTRVADWAQAALDRYAERTDR
ncbi:MAG: WYL domain-containing protein, partial [Mycetocola sp.]